MILKLYNLNKLKLEQNVMLKQKLLAKIKIIDETIKELDESLISSTVEKFGAIGDFKLLAIHKNTLKHEKQQLLRNKNNINVQVEKYNKIISTYEIEIEKYSYLLEEEKTKKLKKLIKYDEEIASEYMQSKFIRNM